MAVYNPLYYSCPPGNSATNFGLGLENKCVYGRNYFYPYKSSMLLGSLNTGDVNALPTCPPPVPAFVGAPVPVKSGNYKIVYYLQKIPG